MEAIFAPVPSSLAEARRMVDESVSAPRDALQDTQLVLTELLANEIKHGRYGREDPLVCKVEQRRSTVRIEVRHHGPPFEIPAQPVHPTLEMRETGWGLALITRLADRWGVIDNNGSRRVWAEIDIARSAAASDIG
jgi:anti-sigma regulatory factor (Ser/Thr protein kinase)